MNDKQDFTQGNIFKKMMQFMILVTFVLGQLASGVMILLGLYSGEKTA